MVVVGGLVRKVGGLVWKVWKVGGRASVSTVWGRADGTGLGWATGCGILTCCGIGLLC